MCLTYKKAFVNTPLKIKPASLTILWVSNGTLRCVKGQKQHYNGAFKRQLSRFGGVPRNYLPADKYTIDHKFMCNIRVYDPTSNFRMDSCIPPVNPSSIREIIYRKSTVIADTKLTSRNSPQPNWLETDALPLYIKRATPTEIITIKRYFLKGYFLLAHKTCRIKTGIGLIDLLIT